MLGEKGEGVATLPSGWYAEDIDGVNTYIKEGYVYKVVNGVSLEIDESGDMHPTSIGGKIVNKLGSGGWRPQ